MNGVKLSPRRRQPRKSNDNRIWTFTLRDNAQWADGTPTACRFVYSWQRSVDPKTLPLRLGLPSGWHHYAQAIIDGKVNRRISLASVPDAHTLRVQLDAAVSGLPV